MDLETAALRRITTGSYHYATVDKKRSDACGAEGTTGRELVGWVLVEQRGAGICWWKVRGSPLAPGSAGSAAQLLPQQPLREGVLSAQPTASSSRTFPLPVSVQVSLVAAFLM